MSICGIQANRGCQSQACQTPPQAQSCQPQSKQQCGQSPIGQQSNIQGADIAKTLQALLEAVMGGSQQPGLTFNAGNNSSPFKF